MKEFHAKLINRVMNVLSFFLVMHFVGPNKSSGNMMNLEFILDHLGQSPRSIEFSSLPMTKSKFTVLSNMTKMTLTKSMRAFGTYIFYIWYSIYAVYKFGSQKYLTLHRPEILESSLPTILSHGIWMTGRKSGSFDRQASRSFAHHCAQLSATDGRSQGLPGACAGSLPPVADTTPVTAINCPKASLSGTP